MFLFSKEQRILRKVNRLLNIINGLSSQYEKMSRDKMLEIFADCKEKVALSAEEYNTKSPIYEQCVVHIFAMLKEIFYRLRNEKPFNAQIIAALCLNECTIIEMRTGQGKTLTAVLSAIFRSIYNLRVHIVTVNDYLAERDYHTMKCIYNYLNISVGYISKNTSINHKINAYKKQVVYISNQDIGFDYLRSNMVYNKDDIMLHDSDFQHAIVDEADSILLDNARIPIVIGANIEGKYEEYYKIACNIISKLSDSDVVINTKEKDVYIKQTRIVIVESYISKYYNIKRDEIYDDQNIDVWFYIDRALRAKYFFRKNYEYIVSKFKVYSIDEYTGRIAKDRKYSDGIQQSIEAKENVALTTESIYANYITTQNIYRKYTYLSGMTGTAYTERKELEIVYKTTVIQIPKEEQDNVYHHKEKFFITKQHKYQYIIKTIKERHKLGQPILIGTSNIHESEELSTMLHNEGVQHFVLNAKKLHQEADIIADAGLPYRVTIATNIAGRGTDIKLGGNVENKMRAIVDTNPDILEQEKQRVMMTLQEEHIKQKQQAESVGGLLVIICQRQENRRIDKQFKGRTGRRSDKGEVMCFTSLEDEIFKNTKTNTEIASIFIDNEEEGTHSILLEYLLNKMQQQIEVNMFESRIKILNYDHMLSKNRDTFFKIRNSILYDKVDLYKSLEMCISKINNMYINDPNFINICTKYITNKIKIDSSSSYLAIKYINKIYNNIIKTNFIEQNYNAIKLKYLSALDSLWSDFINAKEIAKKLSYFNHKVDYILDYSTQLCKLFEKIMRNYDLLLLQSVYNIYTE